MKKWIFIAFISLSGCSPRVVSYLNENAHFKTFETYRLVSAKSESKNVAPENSMIFDLIRQNIHNEMERRDYIKSNVTPDLTLRYEVVSNTRVENDNNQNFGLYPTFRINSRTIYESILLLELTDQNKKLVWQGSYDLAQEKKEKKASRAIEKAVGHIFTTFPYRAKSTLIDESLKSNNKKKESKK
ncbi:protein of unknown function [Ekhidna lutea]|uniref:DUF4136 domain-containing protein n=1 Tax=Ekhidna lutea TaxID=447679 RepID=A0A239H608_EKHLU|nr:DUF4136 domain-containing protein [Ekhidna lutea]SNS76585.1 protein of unknown function [Ekhidna lutea]